MVTFTKIDNVVKVDLGSEVYYINADLPVFAVSPRIFLGVPPQGNSRDYSNLTSFLPTEVNGRPSDDLHQVAAWLVTTYFTGIAGTGGGGGGGDASAANQALEIVELQGLNTKATTMINKSASEMVTEFHDNKLIVYLPGGDIDYVSYKNGGSEVARLTFGYTGNNLTSVVKT